MKTHDDMRGKSEAASDTSLTDAAGHEGQGPCDPRIYLAVERTFLAWIRTGLALMGFGFIAARFALFLRDEAAYRSVAPQHASVSLPMGISLIVLGVLISLIAAVRNHRQISALDRGVFRSAFGEIFATATAGIIIVFGMVIAIYLATL